MDLVYFILTAFGLTQILVYASIFNKIRPSEQSLWGFGEVFHCPMCMGFWVGMFLFFINAWTELFTFKYSIGNMFICGWVSSGTSYLLTSLFGDKGFRTQSSLDKGEEQ